MSVKKLALLSIFIGIASIINILESYVQIIPGTAFKIGFSNIVTLIIIYIYGPKEAVITVVFRLIVTALFAPGTFNGVTFTLSLSGATFSLLTLVFLKQFSKMDLLLVSSLSSLSHVIGQIVAATFIFSNVVAFYAPIMLFVSIPAGILTGVLAKRFLYISRDWFIEKKF